MAARKAYLIDVGYARKNGECYVGLLLKGKKALRRYYRYDPYFYVEAPPEKKQELLGLTASRNGREIVKPLRVEEAELRWGQGTKRLLKLYCKDPSHVPALRSACPFKCYEHNIPFLKRFLFDFGLAPFCLLRYEREGRVIKKIRGSEPGHPELTSLAFDIETYNPQGAPREEKDPIIMVSWCGGKGRGVLSTKPAEGRAFLEVAKDEREMLKRFDAIVRQEDPDVLLGYNSGNFDLPYLWTRSEANKADLCLGRGRRPMRKVKKGLVTGIALDGRIHVDLYPAMRFFGVLGIVKSSEFTLDAVAEAVVGRKKKKINSRDIWKIWDGNDIGELADYSLTDAEITMALGERFLPLLVELSSIARMPLFETALSTSGQLVENLLMHTAVGKKMLVPSRPSDSAVNERLANPIQGAFVKLPEPGIYENLAVLDFRGLYPSIIVSYNIDPATLVQDTERVGQDAAARDTGHSAPGMVNGTPDTECFLSPSGARFLKNPEGLVPSVLNWLLDARALMKRKLKTLDKGSQEYEVLAARVQAVKILTNSFYGYLGYARSRWYSRECAESVTAWGRQHIMDTIKGAEARGFRVLYADTDSVFLIYKDRKDVLSFMEGVNKSLPEKMELELEGFYPRGVFVGKKGKEERGAKKKYALLGEDGRIKIRGFELVRRDWSKIAKETQRRVLESILREGSREKAVAAVQEAVERLNRGDVSMQELAITTQLNKDPEGYAVTSPELSAAKKAMGRGMSVGRGSVISYVVTKSGKTISEKAELAEFAKDYDAGYYINNQVMPAVMKILKELGYDEYELKVGGKQRSLEHFL